MKITRLILFIITITLTSNAVAQTVYTTKTGEKYHKSNCRYLKYSKKETTIKKAKAMGYKACKVCKPTEKKVKIISSKSLSSASIKKPTRLNVLAQQNLYQVIDSIGIKELIITQSQKKRTI